MRTTLGLHTTEMMKSNGIASVNLRAELLCMLLEELNPTRV